MYPFPAIARYNGRGDVNDGENYHAEQTTAFGHLQLAKPASDYIGPDNQKIIRFATAHSLFNNPGLLTEEPCVMGLAAIMRSKTLQQSVLSDLLLWIDNNLDKKLTVDDLSDISGYSRHLFRLFRHYFDRSPMEYIRQQRMSLCCRLLLTTPVTESSIFV